MTTKPNLLAIKRAPRTLCDRERRLVISSLQITIARVLEPYSLADRNRILLALHSLVGETLEDLETKV